MSGLSHKSHGELNQITSKIMLSEAPGDGVNTGVGGAILGGMVNAVKLGNNARKFMQAKGGQAYRYAKGELSPIIKRNLKLDPNKGLAKGLLDKGIKTTVDIGSKVVRDVGGLAKDVGTNLYRTTRGIVRNPYVQGAAALAAAAHDIQKPKGKSFLRGLFNPNEKTQKEEVEILSEETITEASELLYISICGYLLESQLADDVDKAHAIMENMSDTWAEEIIQNVLLAEDE